MTEEKKVKKTTEADRIWEEIKDKDFPIFTLANQKIQDHVSKIDVPGDQLIVTLKSTAVLPVLEEVLGKTFEVEITDKHTLIRRKPVETKE